MLRLRWGLVPLTVAVAVVAGACGLGRTQPRDTGAGALDSPSPVPAAQPLSFDVQGDDGSTARLDLKNIAVAADVTNAAPGEKLLLVTFDWIFTNTTPSREYSLAPFTVWGAAPADSCTKDPCAFELAQIGPVCASVCSQAIPAGGSVRGSVTCPGCGTAGATIPAAVKESFDLSNLFIGPRNELKSPFGKAAGLLEGAATSPAPAGKTCVAMADRPPAGAPAVPVNVGPAPTQLVTKDLKPGTGPEVPRGARVTVNYIGVACSTGKIFDSSYKTGQPVTFSLTQVIKGWMDGIPGMKVGGQRLLGIPPDQAYGANGAPPAIGPNEALWFVVEVLDAR